MNVFIDGVAQYETTHPLALSEGNAVASTPLTAEMDGFSDDVKYLTEYTSQHRFHPIIGVMEITYSILHCHRALYHGISHHMFMLFSGS